MHRTICKALLWVSLLLLWANSGFAAPQSGEEHTADSAVVGHEAETGEHQTEKLNPGEFIFDHINDAHEWHLMTIGHTHVSIPLPVILYSKTKGLNVFMSSKFKHGQASYKGFRLETEGENKNNITDEDGTAPVDLSITKNIAGHVLWRFSDFIDISVHGQAYRKNPVSAPSGLQSWFEPIIVFLRDEVIKPAIGPKYERYTPYLLTLFFFIWINNMLGLIPIPPAGANLTGNIAVTLTLAVFTFVITNISGTREYWKHIFNTPGVPWWLKATHTHHAPG